MRTLATQMRLRRVLRVEADTVARLRGDGVSRAAARAASERLLQLLDDVRDTWARESDGVELGGLRSHVSRSLAALQAAAAAMRRPGADLGRLDAEFREAGVPLVFFLRGLDESESAVVSELAGRPLGRTA